MESKIFLLRPHHALCLPFFQGKGYSGEFVANMAAKKAELENNPTVRLTDGPDEICHTCPNNHAGQCVYAEKVARYDREVLLRCGLRFGDTLPYRELEARVTANILDPDHREQVCGDCEWSNLCRRR